MTDWLKLIGEFHPIAVHFPIALLLTASFLEVVSIWFKNHAGLRFAIIANLTLGTLGAIVAATLGWIDAAHIGMETDLKPVLLWHRWLGTAVAFGALITMALWSRSRSKPEGSLWDYRIALCTLTMMVGITGHLGALLVYGLDYFSTSN